MDYEAFKLAAAAASFSGSHGSPDAAALARRAEALERNGLRKEWVVGGRSGGSCYGGQSDDMVDPDPEPDFDELDDLLEVIAPDITWKQYRAVAKLTEKASRTSHEYYGNYTNYAIKRIGLRALFVKLSELGLIS